MSTLEQKKDIFEEFREKGLKTYLVCNFVFVVHHTDQLIAV